MSLSKDILLTLSALFSLIVILIAVVEMKYMHLKYYIKKTMNEWMKECLDFIQTYSWYIIPYQVIEIELLCVFSFQKYFTKCINHKVVLDRLTKILGYVSTEIGMPQLHVHVGKSVMI